MSKTYRQLEKDFIAGRDIDENWGILRHELSSCYHSLAGIEMGINYYTLCERWLKNSDCAETDSLFGAGEFRRQLCECIEAVYEGKNQSDAAVQLEELRNVVLARTKTLVSYSDCFKLYEYVINRLAPSFEENLADIDNDNTARRILQDIFASNDNAAINENIKLMLQALPVRMTKKHFYDILEGALHEYVGSPYDTFERFLYLVRSSAGLMKPAETEGYFAELNLMLGEFGEVDFQEIGKEQYDALTEKLKRAARLITEATELLLGIQEIANELLVLHYTAAEASEEAHLEAAGLKEIFAEAQAAFEKGEAFEMSEHVREIFESTEGKLEYYVENMQRLEALFDSAKRIESIAGDESCAVLDRCEKLMTDSYFVELDEQVRETPLEEKEFETAFAKLCAELDECFEKDSRQSKRARMASVLGQLPVFFKSRTEVMNYVRSSLDSCHDVAEKLVSVRMFFDDVIDNDSLK